MQLVEAAHKLGLFVITSGNDRLAPAHQFADQYICADYSDKEAILKIAKENKIDYMCSNANDLGLITTVYVCEQLGLPGHDSYETTLRLHHKDSFKEIARRLQLHVPEGKSFESSEEALAFADSLDYKVIIKPIDLVGGTGISTAETHEEKAAAIDKAIQASRGKRIVIERFVEGTAHSMSSYLVGKKVANYYCDNEYILGKPFKISTSAGPATGFAKVLKRLLKSLTLWMGACTSSI